MRMRAQQRGPRLGRAATSGAWRLP